MDAATLAGYVTGVVLMGTLIPAALGGYFRRGGPTRNGVVVAWAIGLGLTLFNWYGGGPWLGPLLTALALAGLTAWRYRRT